MICCCDLLYHVRQGLAGELLSSQISKLMSPSRGRIATYIHSACGPLSPKLFILRFDKEGVLVVGHPPQRFGLIFGFSKVSGSKSESSKSHIQPTWSTARYVQGRAEYTCAWKPYSQWTWAPAFEWRLASLMEKASCSSLISFSLFSSRNNTKESLMSTTSISCWRTRSSSACCSEVLSAKQTNMWSCFYSNKGG